MGCIFPAQKLFFFCALTSVILSLPHQEVHSPKSPSTLLTPSLGVTTPESCRMWRRPKACSHHSVVNKPWLVESESHVKKHVAGDSLHSQTVLKTSAGMRLQGRVSMLWGKSTQR